MLRVYSFSGCSRLSNLFETLVFCNQQFDFANTHMDSCAIRKTRKLVDLQATAHNKIHDTKKGEITSRRIQGPKRINAKAKSRPEEGM